MAFAVRATARPALASASAASKAAKPVAKAVKVNSVAKLMASAAALPALVAAHPAFALVDNRLGGEGTGKVLGVSGPEGWAFVIVPTIIWSLYWASQKDLGDGPKKGGEGEDSGLSL